MDTTCPILNDGTTAIQWIYVRFLQLNVYDLFAHHQTNQIEHLWRLRLWMARVN